MSLDYQMVSLQAVMAELLEGDTIHHALGINPFGDKPNKKTKQRQTDIANRILQWRWLFIDEISMVSAKLLAEVDHKLRSIMSDVNKLKKDASGHPLPFGGLNVVFVGDFWQLDPPKGGFLANIPVDFMRNARKYDPKPDVAYGQALFWHEGRGSVQGITELTECVRTEDAWLLQIQKEMRAGALSTDSWHFLHGRETNVPGSSVDGHNTCGNHSCSTTWRESKIECDICKEER